MKKKMNSKYIWLFGVIIVLAIIGMRAIDVERARSTNKELEFAENESSVSDQPFPEFLATTEDENMKSESSVLTHSFQEMTIPAAGEIVLDTDSFTSVVLGHNLTITDIGKYTGIFMEDGTDEVVSGILMLVVENSGQQDIQYAEITVPTDKGEALFVLSTLPAGESCVLLEKNRISYSGNEDVNRASVDKVAVFQETLSLQEDKIQLQVLDGALNVTNISGRDINGDVTIYYKNAASDMYYGGITYRVRIVGGLKAGELKQIMASHFSDSGSRIIFITLN